MNKQALKLHTLQLGRFFIIVQASLKAGWQDRKVNIGFAQGLASRAEQYAILIDVFIQLVKTMKPW